MIGIYLNRRFIRLALWLYLEVGLDVHEKFVITKEFSFTKTDEHGSKATTLSYSSPKEIYIIEADNKNGPKATAGDTQFLSNSNKVQSSV